MDGDAKEAESDKHISIVAESESISSESLWKEVKEWRNYWKSSIFFKALFLGLGASLFDFLTDFNFARSVPEDCANTTDNNSKPFNLSLPCGFIFQKNIERVTYTFIAFLGIACLQRLL